eukprot:8904619-Pyramimonas_sp.AAC.1
MADEEEPHAEEQPPTEEENAEGETEGEKDPLDFRGPPVEADENAHPNKGVSSDLSLIQVWHLTATPYIFQAIVRHPCHRVMGPTWSPSPSGVHGSRWFHEDDRLLKVAERNLIDLVDC